METTNEMLATKQAWKKRRKYEEEMLKYPIDSKKFHSALMTVGSIILCGIILIIASCKAAFAAEIDMQKIAMIESSGCKEKFGRYEHARGCWQITQPVIDEWNAFHKNEIASLNDMLNDAKCFKVANWYMNVRIPQMLRAYKKPVTVTNQIIAWNAGIGYVVKNKPLPTITKRYLQKYGA